MKSKILNILFILYLFGVTVCNAQEDSVIVVVLGEESVKNDDLIEVAFGEVAKTDALGAITNINIKELFEKSYSISGADDVRGMIGGYTGGIWGQSSSDVLILVDGVPRSIETIHGTEIESVSVLKGASAVVLYGSRAAKGVILITTKRGAVSPLKVDVRANTGLYLPKAYPNYLDAASYMTLYNEASVNDGIPVKYSDERIYNTYLGNNPYRYPDLNFYSSEYLRKAYNKTDVLAEISGGTEKTRYYTNFGFTYNNDQLKYGEHKNNHTNNFHLRSNVDMQLNNWLSASTDVGIVFENKYYGRGDYWGNASTLRPNWVSPLIPVDMLDPNLAALQTFVDNSNHVVDGKYLLGGSSTMQDNIFSEMLEGGYIKHKYRVFQFRENINADLSGILHGLSFNTVYSLDYINNYSEAFRYLYAVYEPVWSNMNGEDMVIGLTKYNEDKPYSNNEYVGETIYAQTMCSSSSFNYKRSFGKHNVDAKLIGWGYQMFNSSDSGHGNSDYHKTSNLNLGAQASYNYNSKYYIDLAVAQVHSAKLPEANRRAFSPSVTTGWRLSDESFMQSASFIDDLKLYTSYSVLNQDLDIQEFYMYKGYYAREGWYSWNDGAASGNTTRSKRGDNPNLNFVQREEITVGLSASLLTNKVLLEANYFHSLTNGMLAQATTVYPSYFRYGSEDYLPYINYNNDKRTGIDFNFNYNDKIGEVAYTLGFNGMYYSSEVMQRDEVRQEDYQYRVGKPIDAAWGYISEGFFIDQADIDNHATQTFGEVKPGDIKYKDYNNDGVIDGNDEVYLGKYGSPFSYGVHLTLKWKHLTFFALGTGQNGAVGFKSGAYYQVYGDRKYTEEVLGRWTQETKNTATYPRLTTTGNTNNFRNSTFWMYDNKRFDLTKVQITYDLSEKVLKNPHIKGLNVYVSGENLLTLSKERKLMEISTGTPYYRFFNLGCKVSF